MELIKTGFDGLFLIESPKFNDPRGSFQKVYNRIFFLEHGLECDFCELYYSVNQYGVIRGMHFQTPPEDHVKLVYVTKGEIIDVVVDIRTSSSTYGKHYMTTLSEDDDRYLYIPRGFAHGFASLETGTIVNYAQTSCYSPEHDCGILASSCGIKWPFNNPIVSGRDLTFEALSNFKSPF